MTPGHFQRLLKEATGLDAASVGDSAIARAVAQRRRACALPSLSRYWEHLHASPTEMQALIEEVVVPETWFFRDAEAFAALGRIGRDWLRANPGDVLRLLSLPCSTGEEPYSMSMTLLDAGVPPDRFRIDAMDISERVIARARLAVYGKNSFRGARSLHGAHHFQDTPAGRQLHSAVCAQVDFHKGNVLEASHLPARGPYDLIFSRNLLIYFDRDTQDRAVRALSAMLKPGGILFAGSSEAGILLNHGFVPTAGPMTFGFQQPGPTSRTPSRAKAHRRATKAIAAAPAVRPAAAAIAVVAPAPAATDLTDSYADLDRGIELANLGRFAEATTYCEAHIRQSGPSADAFHTLGLVRDACGNGEEAVMNYRKALYLNPRHEEALLHLALLLETRQQHQEAQRLRSRAKRVAEQHTQGA